MEGNIFIYGDIYHDQSDNAKEYGAVSLKSVIDQINAAKEADTLVVHIHSRGGDVNEGWAIHDAIVATGKEIITINEGMVGSIATVPYLAAKKENRRSLPNAKTFIHNPWGGLMGDAKEIAKYGDDLKKEEEKLAKFYSEQTGHDIEDIISKMDAESEFTAEEAKELGFVGSISEPLKAVAKYTPKRKQTNKVDMSEVKDELKEQKSLLTKIMDKLNMNKKALAYTLDNGDIVETEGDAELAEGQSLTMDGEPLGEGTYTLEDGTSVVVDSDGVVTSITSEEGEDEMEALKSENEELKAKLETMEAEASKNTELLEEVKGEVAKLAKMQSTYKPKAQAPSFKKPTSDVDGKEAKESYEEIKARRKEKRNKKNK
jgi:ATP-dependent Clp endopeptidase proteolytic subunit ClpP